MFNGAKSLTFQRRLGLEVLNDVGTFRAEEGHADVPSEPLGARNRSLGLNMKCPLMDSSVEHLATSLQCYFRKQWKL